MNFINRSQQPLSNEQYAESQAQDVMKVWNQFKQEQLSSMNARAIARKPNQYWQGQSTWLHANKLWQWPNYLKAHRS